MTGKLIIEEYPYMTEADKRVFEYVLDIALAATSNNKLSVEDRITTADLSKAIQYLEHCAETGELQSIIDEAVDILDSGVLEFYSFAPIFLADVQNMLQEQAQTSNVDLMDALKSVYSDFASSKSVPNFITYLEYIVEREQER